MTPKKLNDHDQDIHFVEVDVKDMTDPKHKTEKMRVPMILPHEILDFLTVP